MPRATTRTACDCPHDPRREHDAGTGACLSINPIHGACPCAATPESMRRAQDYVAKHKLRPMIQTLERELVEARTRSSQDWRGMLDMVTVLLRDDPVEIEPLRVQYRRALAMAQEAAAQKTTGVPQ